MVRLSMQRKPSGGMEVINHDFSLSLSSILLHNQFSLGIHAREWISPATNIYITQAFLSNYSKDATITHLVDQFDYYILPVFNVDGYAYTWTNGRFSPIRQI